MRFPKIPLDQNLGWIRNFFELRLGFRIRFSGCSFLSLSYFRTIWDLFSSYISPSLFVCFRWLSEQSFFVQKSDHSKTTSMLFIRKFPQHHQLFRLEHILDQCGRQPVSWTRCGYINPYRKLKAITQDRMFWCCVSSERCISMSISFWINFPDDQRNKRLGKCSGSQQNCFIFCLVSTRPQSKFLTTVMIEDFCFREI